MAPKTSPRTLRFAPVDPTPRRQQQQARRFRPDTPHPSPPARRTSGATATVATEAASRRRRSTPLSPAQSAFSIAALLDAQGSDKSSDHDGGLLHSVLLEELLDGRCPRRRRHDWMWAVFPRHRALHRRGDAEAQYALRGLDDAAAVLAHPVLGKRLRAAALAAVTAGQRSQRELDDRRTGRRMDEAGECFGREGARWFHASMTLFALAGTDKTAVCFDDALLEFFAGRLHRETVAALAAGAA